MDFSLYLSTDLDSLFPFVYELFGYTEQTACTRQATDLKRLEIQHQVLMLSLM